MREQTEGKSQMRGVRRTESKKKNENAPSRTQSTPTEPSSS
jgi:hypothetical protein